MKFFILAFGIASALFSASAMAGPYVCKRVGVDWNSGVASATPIESALNSMSCDTAKPISTTPVASTDGAVFNIIVCCVQK